MTTQTDTTQQQVFSANAKEVFGIPEIVDSLVQQAVAENITGILYNCLTLNRLWFDKVAQVLWETESLSEQESPFFKIEPRDRRQVYANYISNAAPHADYLDKIDGVQFPKLQRATIQNAPAGAVETILHSLPASLAVLSVDSGTSLTDEIFKLLAEKFTGLQMLQVGQVKGASKGFHELLAKGTSKMLYFMDLHDAFADPQAHVALSENSTVESLYIPTISEEALALVKSLDKPSFVNVKTYTASGRFNGQLANTLEVFPNLEAINTTVCDIDEAVQAIAKYPSTLKSVTVTGASGNPRPESLIKLAKQQPNLTRLRLGRMANLVVEDAWFTEFASHLPSLVTLSIYNTTANITSKGLKSVAKSCPKLSALVLAPGDTGDIALEKDDFTAEESPLFPALKVLRPTVSLEFDHELLLKHFPILPAVNPSAAVTI